MSIKHINYLPTELLTQVLNYGTQDDIIYNFKEVCTQWEAIVLKILQLGNQIQRWKLHIPLMPANQYLRRYPNFCIPRKRVRDKKHLHILIADKMACCKKLEFMP